MKPAKDMTVEEIRDALDQDGYPSDSETAGSVKLAAERGCLLWTKEKIVTTDDSRLSLFAHDTRN